MSSSCSFGVKQTIAALILSGFIASGVSAMTLPVTRAPEVLVNRAHKGDRLAHAPAGQKMQINPMSTVKTSMPERPPLGCDAAFSPVADPARGYVFGRCMV